jgi:hypothetical protein
MNVPNNFEEMVRTHMQATSIAFDAGYKAGYEAALHAMEGRLQHLSENTRAIIAASRETSLTKLQAG